MISSGSGRKGFRPAHFARTFRLVFANESCYFPSMTVPPRDSSIRLAPGEEFTLDSDGSHEWRAKTSSLRTARGTILALAFEVEHSIDVVINRFFFPADDKASEDLKTLFVGLFLKSPSASFARKIQVFKAISQQPILSNLVRPDLLRKSGA